MCRLVLVVAVFVISALTQVSAQWCDIGPRGVVSVSKLEIQPSRTAVFSQVANGMGYYTGLAFFNPNSEDATVDIQVFAADGQKTGNAQLTLAAGHRISKLLPELVESTAGPDPRSCSNQLIRTARHATALWHGRNPGGRAAVDSEMTRQFIVAGLSRVRLAGLRKPGHKAAGRRTLESPPQ